MRNLPAIIKGKLLPLLIFISAFIYFSSGIEKSPIFMYDEAHNSECAREMYELGDLVVPSFNYTLRTDKPPLHYYFMMLSYSVFGVNEFAARFFSSVFGALTILLTFLTARKYLGLKQGLYTILVLFASLNLALEFHLAVPDPYFIFFMTASHVALFKFLVARKPEPVFLMYLFTGLSVMAKGPIAIVLTGLNALIWLIVKKELTWDTIKQFRLIAGLLIVSAVVAPWSVAIGLATNWNWWGGFIFDHNLGRFTGELEGHGGFFGLTIAFVIIAFLPFAVFIIQSYMDALRKRKENDLLLFSTIISLVIIFFFSLSATKLPNYPMPAYPFVAMIIGNYLTLERSRHLHWLLIINLVVSLAVPAVVHYLIRQTPEISSLNNIAPLFMVIPFSAIIALWLWFRYSSYKGVIIAISMGWIVASMTFFLWILPLASRQEPVQPAVSLMDTSKAISYYRRFNSAFPFYLKKPIQKLISKDEINGFFNAYPDGYLISAAEYDEELKGLPLKEIFRKKDLMEPPVTVIYKWDSLGLK
jgi:4-amino-4-deoxy-L-arabinose transferase-like glycosyltransferase